MKVNVKCLLQSTYSLSLLLKEKMSIKTSLDIAIKAKELQPYTEVAEKSRNDFLKNNGMMDEATNQYKLSAEKQIEFESLLYDEKEINILPFDADILEKLEDDDVQIAPEVMLNLLFLFPRK